MTHNQTYNWRAFCKESLDQIDNYQQALAEKFKGWCIHHRLEIQPDGTRVSMQELKSKGLYYGRPASELIFMRCGENKRLHLIGNTNTKGRTLSAEHCKKIAEANKGKHHSTEARKKMSETLSGENNPLFGKHRSAETRKKIAESLKGKHLSAETRQKMSEAHKGKHWYNNGVKCIKAKTCPEGFVPGRIK